MALVDTPFSETCILPFFLSLYLAENTHYKGKYHCTADLLFDLFGFDQTSKTVFTQQNTKQLNPNKIKSR